MATPASSEWLSRTGRVTRAGPELWILSMTDAIIGLDGAVRTTRRFMPGAGRGSRPPYLLEKWSEESIRIRKSYACLPAVGQACGIGPDIGKGGRSFRTVRLSSGGRTRTSDLWVMSPTSCQLLHPAVLWYKDNQKKQIRKKYRLYLARAEGVLRTIGWLLFVYIEYGMIACRIAGCGAPVSRRFIRKSGSVRKPAGSRL